MSSAEALATIVSDLQMALPIEEVSTSAMHLQNAAVLLEAAGNETTALGPTAELLASATEAGARVAENLQTSQGHLTAYLGSIGVADSIQQEEQPHSRQTPEKTVLDEYRTLLTGLKDTAAFDEPQATRCLQQVVQTSKKLLQAGCFQELLELRGRANDAYRSLPIMQYPSRMGHAELWADELNKIALDLIDTADAHPDTELSHTIIDNIFLQEGVLHTGNLRVSSFIAKHLSASIQRTHTTDTRIISEASAIRQRTDLTEDEKYDLIIPLFDSFPTLTQQYLRYAAIVQKILNSPSAPAEIREQVALTIAAFYRRPFGEPRPDNYVLGNYILEKVLTNCNQGLLRAFGFDAMNMSSAWLHGNGGPRNNGNTKYFSKEAYAMHNITTISELEGRQPGSARFLYETLGIHNFGRHSVKTLLDAYRLCDGDALKNPSGPIAVLISFRPDHNGANQRVDLHDQLRSQLQAQGGHLLPVEIQRREDILRIRGNLRTLGMKRTPLLIIDVHGSPHSIVSDEMQPIDSHAVRDGLGALVKRIVEKNGRIVLYGCSNGKLAEGFAQVVADSTGRQVIASPDDLGMRSITISTDEDGSIIPHPVFVDTKTGKEVQCVHFKSRR